MHISPIFLWNTYHPNHPIPKYEPGLEARYSRTPRARRKRQNTGLISAVYIYIYIYIYQARQEEGGSRAIRILPRTLMHPDLFDVPWAGRASRAGKTRKTHGGQSLCYVCVHFAQPKQCSFYVERYCKLKLHLGTFGMC